MRMRRLDQIQYEQPAHPIVREALPHLDEEEQEQPRGMAEERHRTRPSATAPAVTQGVWLTLRDHAGSRARIMRGAACLLVVVVVGCAAVRPRVPAESGIDPDAIDRSVNPCDDFYDFACGGWAARTSIPPDRPSWSRSFSEITERNLAGLRDILEAAAAAHFEPGDEEARKLGDFHATCMDESKAETASADTLRGEFARIDGISDRESLARAVAQLHLRDVNALFVFRTQQDLRDASEEIGAADQGGLGLPERDYYLKRDPRSVALRDQYRDHVARMLELSGESADVAAKHARTVMGIETALAGGSMPVVERRNPYNVYHRIDRDGLEHEAPVL